jgi:hypothetical protein
MLAAIDRGKAIVSVSKGGADEEVQEKDCISGFDSDLSAA